MKYTHRLTSLLIEVHTRVATSSPVTAAALVVLLLLLLAPQHRRRDLGLGHLQHARLRAPQLQLPILAVDSRLSIHATTAAAASRVTGTRARVGQRRLVRSAHGRNAGLGFLVIAATLTATQVGLVPVRVDIDVPLVSISAGAAAVVNVRVVVDLVRNAVVVVHVDIFVVVAAILIIGADACEVTPLHWGIIVILIAVTVVIVVALVHAAAAVAGVITAQPLAPVLLLHRPRGPRHGLRALLLLPHPLQPLGDALRGLAAARRALGEPPHVMRNARADVGHGGAAHVHAHAQRFLVLAAVDVRQVSLRVGEDDVADGAVEARARALGHREGLADISVEVQARVASRQQPARGGTGGAGGIARSRGGLGLLLLGGGEVLGGVPGAAADVVDKLQCGINRKSEIRK